MAIFTVQTFTRHSDGNHKYAYVETEHESVGALLSALKAGPVLCQKLRATYDSAANQMIVTERKEYAIGAPLVASIEMQNIPFVEAA